ncbi:MAG: PEP/pyruvate-binding domain-containing protein [Candidatus Binatia bacterium]
MAAKQVAPADARRLVDLDVTAAAVLQRRGSAVVEGGVARPVRQHVRLLGALTQAAYGAGLLLRRERDAALDAVHALEASPTPARRDAAAALARAERVVEWAQANATLAFAEVWAPWTFLLPQVASIGDDILRSSPLLLYAQVSRRLDDWAAGSGAIRHDLFGTAVGGDVRALNPGLALGRLRVAPRDGTYQRDEVVALPETPAELQPAAGILTQGEGNVLSHVQLLARSLGIPNVVVGPAPFRALRPHDGQRVLLLVTPGGRVVLEEASAMNAQERAVYEEYTRNEQRAADGSLGGGSAKLHIDRARIDVASAAPRDLAEVRRADSGRFCGPKAAYLGELKHLVPDKVARGVVVPFGAYYAHYQHATVAVPEALAKAGLARPGEPLPAFVERTYREFFDTLIPARTSERELSAWIAPRLEVIRHSIRRAPLAAELREGIRDQLARQGLLLPDDRSQTVGCFVRSDTNVEDLDTFNGAGLNLTVFNRRSLDDIYEGLKEVWASPFELRSFSWRQTLIDEPLWVLPSVVILESVPSEKSGVLVTADVTTGDPGKMLVATSEGVGGAVDGTPAETLLWSPQGVELVTLFKSPWRRVLEPGGGSTIVASSGRDVVLAPDELAALVAAAQRIGAALEPTRDAAGKARPWDIEFGFARGHLWLFQTRPFVGNDALKNVAALAALEPPRSADAGRLSLEDALR